MILRNPKSARGAVALITSLAFLSLQLPTAAFAQGVNVTQGEALYNQGKDLIGQKKYHEACERFAASYKLDENQNTMVALAACHDLEGKTATAWGEYLQVAQKARGTPAADYATDQAKALEPKLLKVKLVMPLIPNDLALKIDGVPYPKDVIGADLPLDPGEHDVEAKAPGKHDWARHIKLTAAESPLVVNLSMEDLTPEEIAALEKARVGGRPGNKEEIVPGSPIKRWTGVGMMAAGLGATIYGIYAIAQYSSKRSSYDAESRNGAQGDCPQTNPGGTGLNCHVLVDSSGAVSGTGHPYADYANAFGLQAAIVGGLGVVFLGVGAVLFFTSFESKRVTKTDDAIRLLPSVAPGYAGFSLSGAF